MERKPKKLEFDCHRPNKMSAIAMVRFCETADDWIAMICNQCKIRRPSKASYWFNVCEAVFDSLKGQTTLSERLAEIVEICHREIACRQKTAARCEMCIEDSSAGEDCPYYGEPNGCNSPTYGEHPPALNMMAMRQAMEFIKLASDDYETYGNTKAGALDVIYEKACAALAAPPRNCDVGTADELDARHSKWCCHYGIDGDMKVACAHQDMSCTLCALRWSQMPYEEGVDYGK